MDILKWQNKFSTDLKLKYSNSADTRKNYYSCVTTFLHHFREAKEPKAIPTDDIKLYLLTQFTTANTLRANLCAVKAFYSINAFLKYYKERAQVNAVVTAHKFRHSNATALLEQGTDIRIIQKQLGHNSIKTTQIYTHVSKAVVANIYSPINNITLNR